MLAAVQATWGSLDRVIMCMSHNERMLNGPGGLEFARPPGKLVYRNSDDFNLKYADAHQDFVRWNVYSSILTGHLALHLDFDMFSTTPQSRWPLYHALLRALGPGPLLVSDAPGEISDCTVLERLTARDSKGKLVGVKTDRPAMVPSVRWFWDNVQDPGEGPALVAVVPVPEAHGGLIAAWNARKAEGGGQAIDTITQAEVYPALADVGIADRHDRYVIWRVGLSSEARHEVITGDWPGMSMRIQSGNCELLVVAPVWRIGARRLAVLGMLDKLAPLAGLQIDADEGALTLQSRYVAEIAVLELGADEACEVLHAGDGAGGSVPVRREKVDGAELHYVSLGTDGPESFRVRLI